MLCATGICLVDLAFPWVSRLCMNELLPGKLYSAFFAVMAVLALSYLLRSAFYFVVTYWGHQLGVRIEADIRRDLFSHMQDLSFSFYDKNRTGQLMSRVTGDLFEITELAHHGPEDLFISSVTLLGALCVMLTIAGSWPWPCLWWCPFPGLHHHPAPANEPRLHGGEAHPGGDQRGAGILSVRDADGQGLCQRGGGAPEI